MVKGMFVTATDTGVGKTEIASAFGALLLAASGGQTLPEALVDERTEGRLASGLTKLEGGLASRFSGKRIGLWKPVQSGVRLGDPEADSYRLKYGSGIELPEEELAGMTLPEPLAPWIAAQRAGTAIDFAGLVQDGRRRLADHDVTIVEGAGGLAVPVTHDRVMADLAAELGLPLLIVARPGLGTVNHTVMTVSYARSKGLRIAGILLNGAEDPRGLAVEENAMMIERFSGVPVAGILPWVEGEPEAVRAWPEWRKRWIKVLADHVDFDKLSW